MKTNVLKQLIMSKELLFSLVFSKFNYLCILRNNFEVIKEIPLCESES